MINTKVWITQNDIPRWTSLAGNIDADSLYPFIEMAQTEDLMTILGIDLYNKIDADFIANNLQGVYLFIFEKYIQKMLVYFSCARYISLASSKISINGITKAEQSSDLKEIDRLSAKYNGFANTVMVNFLSYLAKNPIIEYTSFKEVKRKTNIINWF